jgi:type VI secretion system protein ImpJ
MAEGPARARNPWSADTLSRSLCRVRWRLGQALLPEHFFRQEFSLRQEWELRFGQLALPSWGVGLVEWDEALIPRGFAKLGKLMLVFPRGQLVHVPGNAQPVHFDLNTAEGVEVALYAHLLSAPDSVRDDEAAGDAAGVELLLHKLELSPEPGHPGAIDSVKLAEFSKRPDGRWSQRPSYVPPLLLLSAAPAFFRATLDRLLGVVQRWQELLLADIETHALATEKVVRAQECLRRSHQAIAALAHIDAENPFRHEEAGGAVNAAAPADVYRWVQELYIDIHTYQEDPRQPPRLAGAPYDHREPFACFERLLGDLDRRTELPRGQTPYVAFTAAGEAAVATLPREAREAKEVYFLYHRRGPAVREELRGLKVACRARLETVHRHALKGIPLRRVQPVPFRHSFAPEVEFYQLLPGEEWEHALRQGTLAYFTEGALKDGQAYLYWRAG